MAQSTLDQDQMFNAVFRPVTATYRRSTYSTINPLRPELSTKGKTAIVTGAGAGIGAAIAKSLAKSGVSSIALIGRTETKLHATKNEIAKLSPSTKAYVYTLDIVDLEAVTSALNSFVSTTGSKIDILIANAGYMPNMGTIAGSDPADWWEAYEVNIKGNFNLLHSYVPHAAPNGRVIHISSAAIHMMYLPKFSGYRGSKMGATKVFEIFGREMKELNNGVRTLQVHPGLVRTGVTDKLEVEDDGVFVFDDVELSGDFTHWCLSEEANFLDGKLVWANWDVDELIQKKAEIEANEDLYTMKLAGW